MQARNFRITKMLLDAGARVEREEGGSSGNPLHAAAKNGDEGAVKILLDHGVNPNAKNWGTYDFERKNALHYVSRSAG
jgi:ankyrin repeat protein